MTTTTAIQRPDVDEHRALLEDVGLFDRSERGKLSVTGDEAGEFLDSLLSNDVKSLTEGTGCYATLLTHKGRLLADVRVLRTLEGIWLDTERPGLQALFDALTQFRIGYRAELHKQTLQRGLVSLIGPGSDGILARAPGEDEHDHVATDVAGRPVRAIRTDLGIDVLRLSEDGETIAAA